ncbi:MAG: FKBP-type peptidyl-prolyl cis-trans isomerase N-terminal domain-containing protein [Fibrobacterota bacterium]
MYLKSKLVLSAIVVFLFTGVSLAEVVQRVESLDSDTDKFSYSIGYYFGEGIAELHERVDFPLLISSLMAGMEGQEPIVTPEEAQEIQQKVITEVQQEQQEGVEASGPEEPVYSDLEGEDNVVEAVESVDGDIETFSYAVGFSFGKGLEGISSLVNPSVLISSIVAGIDGEEALISQEEAQEIQKKVMTEFQQEQGGMAPQPQQAEPQQQPAPQQ